MFAKPDIPTKSLQIILMIIWGFVPFAHGAEEFAEKPVLLFLPGDSQNLNIKKTFLTELSLELDTYQVISEEGFNFSSDSQPKRIEEIRPLSLKYNARVVMWIEDISEQKLALQVVFIAPSRASIQSIEIEKSPDAPLQLVISAKELLNEYQNNIIPEKPVEINIQNSQPENDHNTEEEIKGSKGSFFISPGINLSGGIWEQPEITYLTGGDLTGGYLFNTGLLLQLEFSAFLNPDRNKSNGKVKTWGIMPEVAISWLFKKNFFEWGPFLGIGTKWQKITTTINDITSNSSWWDLKLTPSLNMNFNVSKSVSINIRGGIGFYLNSQIFKTPSDGKTIYSSPLIDWNSRVGVTVKFK
ncbi:MAG: hypothetical protein JXR91_06845 [Deltaproteobacteria bacterium]|nr:hypothetical protein [Deltaproteobacteria bacterium]